MIFDAHQHLHDVRLQPHRDTVMAMLPKLGIGGGVGNGTRESDWEAVAAFCAAYPGQRPAFGLHPWFVAQRTAQWEATLERFLDAHPEASLGETGLDGWIEGHDIEDQKRLFIRQLAISRDRNRAITVHCLKAHEPLRQVLEKHAGPARGFLLHAWSGPASLTPFLLERGAHFSFPPYFLHARKEAQRALFQSLPADRILVETDAPDLIPPPEHNRWPLTNPDTGAAVNHPANLVTACEALASLRGVSVADLSAVVTENWHRLFSR